MRLIKSYAFWFMLGMLLTIFGVMASSWWNVGFLAVALLGFSICAIILFIGLFHWINRKR